MSEQYCLTCRYFDADAYEAPCGQCIVGSPPTSWAPRNRRLFTLRRVVGVVVLSVILALLGYEASIDSERMDHNHADLDFAHCCQTCDDVPTGRVGTCIGACWRRHLDAEGE